MDLIERIKSSISQLELTDFRVFIEGNHVKIIAVSNMFDSMPKVKAHQMINRAMKDFLSSGEIHALHVVTMNDEQWRKDKFLY